MIIGGGGRTGGSLLLRLLDGHPRLSCHHAFYRFMNEKYGILNYCFFPEISHFKNRVDYLNRWFSLSGQMISINKQTGMIVKGGMEKFQAGITEQEFLKRLQSRLERFGKRISLRNFIETLNECLAEAFCTHYHNTKFFVGHWAGGWLLVDAFFRNFPDGRFIHTIRDPRSQIASVKMIMEKKGKPANIDIRAIMKFYLISCDIALRNIKRYADRYIVVFHNQLIRNTESEIRNLCNLLGIDFEKKCLAPSYMDQAWGDHMGNYNDKGNVEGLVERSHLQKYKEILSRDEMTYCNKYADLIDPVMQCDTSNEAVECLKILSRLKRRVNGDLQDYEWMDYANGKRSIKPLELNRLHFGSGPGDIYRNTGPWKRLANRVRRKMLHARLVW